MTWVAAALFALACLAVPAAAADLAIVGGTLIDGRGGPPLADATILVRDGRFVAVGRRDAVAVPTGAERIDAAGAWVIPGLVDAHIHLFQSSGLYARPDVVDLRGRRSYAAETAATRAALPATRARLLASGITAALDLGGPLWTLAARDDPGPGPRLAATGPLLATLSPPELASSDPPIVAIASPDAAEQLLDRLLPLRPDLIKIWFVRPPRDLEPSLAWVRAIVARAGGAGIRVVAHATQLRAARAMIEAGVGLLAHSVDDAVIPDDLLARMAADGVVYIPTLAVTEGYRRVLSRSVALFPMEERSGDPAAIASWRELPANLGSGPPPAPAVHPMMAQNLRRAAAAGVTIAAGSDSGNIGTLHGPGLHRELELMVAAGLSPMAVLVAATRGGAVAIGLSDEIGTVEAGKRADLVILEGDPLADIRNTRRIRAVVRGGIAYSPSGLLAGTD